MKKIETNAEYHASAPLGRSRLWRLSKSPEWFRYCEDHPEDGEKSESLIVGSAFHKLVLEPDLFESEFSVLPELDRRTKAGRELYESYVASGKQLLSHEQYELISAMRDSVRRHKHANFLCVGECERSYYFSDGDTGVELKVRPDCFKLVNGRGIIVDLKSCRSAATEDFVRDAVKLGYDLQAAMYKIGVECELGIPCDFVFVAVEKTAPYMVNVLKADELFLRRGGDLFREYLGLYKHCCETGNWFGYNGESGMINDLGLPLWLAKEVE